MKNLILFFLLIFATGINAEAQEFRKLRQGQAGDTLVTSLTVKNDVNLNTLSLQTVAVQVAIDSVSGTPSGTATLYKSIDGINYVTTGQAKSWTTGRDTSFILTDTTFYGAYLRIGLTATGTTQKSKVSATLKSWNK